jgi:hypothetical protein
MVEAVYFMSCIPLENEPHGTIIEEQKDLKDQQQKMRRINSDSLAL